MARMTIGDFARASGLTAKALRLYDDMGLVVPATVDESNGYRYYEPEQLERARLVAQLRLIGMPLHQIRAVADLPHAARRAALLSYWRQVEADHASRRSRLSDLVEASRDKERSMLIDNALETRVAARGGIGQREHQLDAAHAGRHIFAVADGFGEPPSVAEEVIAVVAEYDTLHGMVDPLAVVDELVDRAAAAAADRVGSGCTLTALLLGEGQAVVAHVGDSRLYLVRDGRLQLLTRDHTLVQSLVDEGRLSLEEARTRDDRILINRAIAADCPVAPDVAVLPTMPGDRFVLTTDGIHGQLAGAVLADLLTEPASADAVVNAVESGVFDAGAPDNYHVVVVDLP